MNGLIYIISAIVIWNIVTLMIYGADKRKAIAGKRRISEKTLILCAFLFGGVGAMLGMAFFRHKTKHLKFTICVPLAVVVNAAVIALIIFFNYK